MKILFIAPTLPLNKGSGGSIRSFQLFTELSYCADIDVMTADWNKPESINVNEFSKAGNYLGHIEIPWKRDCYFEYLDLSPKIRSNLNKYDYIFIRYFNTAYWLGALEVSKLILDCDDCYNESSYPKKNTTIKKLSGSSFALEESYKNEAENPFKIDPLEFYNISLEKIYRVIFSRRGPHINWRKNHFLIPNRIKASISYEKINKRKKPSDINIMFVGVLNYAPNYEGLNHFIENIWPLVLKKNKHIRLTIAGDGTPTDLIKKWLSCPNITMLGYVNNLDEVYANCDFSIVPIYSGSGTHIKIMESLIHYRSLIISEFAHRGYQSTLLEGESLLIGKDDKDFAEKIILLAEAPHYRDHLSETGRDQVIKFHTIKPNYDLFSHINSDKKISEDA